MGRREEALYQKSLLVQYYILSVSNGPVGEDALWWRPEAKGYTINLDKAGKYDGALVESKPGYYNNGKSAKAIPCEVVDHLAAKHVLWDELPPGLLR